MTMRSWHVEHEWQEEFVASLRRRGASGQAVSRALTEVDERLGESGRTALEELGPAREYAEQVVVTTDAETERASRTRALLLALLGLVGMFLALWGITGVARQVDSLAGMAPKVPLVVGIVVVLAAAVADAALGRRADFVHAELGQARAQGAGALLLNRLGPWLVVLLTAVGMLLIWTRYR